MPRIIVATRTARLPQIAARGNERESRRFSAADGSQRRAATLAYAVHDIRELDEG